MGRPRRLSETQYQLIHQWIERHLGKADHCDFADETCSTHFQHSNISQEYRKDLSDWQQLCISHHKRYDMSDSFGERVSKWMKGKTNHAVAIVQVDDARQVSYLHESTASAARELKILKTSINNCLMGLSLTAGGFRWQKRG